MKRVFAVMLVTIVACACPSKATKNAPEPTAGSATQPPAAGGCDAVKAKVEGLYRAEAQVREPKRVDEYTADNTAMVMSECAKAPDKVSACIAGVTTVKDLEASCMPKLDDEGSETDVLKH